MKNSKGFTLIEVLLVVILISILAGIVIPRFMVSTKQAKVQACEMQRQIINKEVENFYFVEASWPMDSLDDIKVDPNYFPDGIPTCPIDQTSYRLVPSPYHRVQGHREGSDTHIWTEYRKRP